MAYIPKMGDIVWLDFDPQAGHEQQGRRPALVVSNDAFNAGNLCIACPITSRNRNYPLHVELDSSTKIQGVIMCDQIKALDYSSRNLVFEEKAPDKVVNAVREIIQEFFEQ